MLIYPARSVGTFCNYQLHLIDWPEVSLSGAEYSVEKFNGALRTAVRQRARDGALIPLPRSKLRDGVDARLSVGESMKVMVLNELVRSGVSHDALADGLRMPVGVIRAGLDIARPTDIELLEKIVATLQRRWVAYIA